ncbi:uncharacterized protein A4U43_C01F6870 [Asparagus officinalis]|uniref:WRKY domain-containing protein n=1 Tax=Asparagus officinalis TaxID=4686 RepID=A0A5P1FMM4_ASPOF|nr:probable WRKY transcription factor 35 [Asparagus officinalis]XP_020275977.1 probable WRKY transcription factor 35 [Asparagus officinalis]ONK71478.1 uncharacterized protein A4U43_C04F9070 [Asparagus officinalis]ONK79488.1 uncharacterized protein A4U43_C01F6870 [Asparagus officinalis]
MIAQQQKLVRVGDEMKRPCSSLFSRVLQISPAKVPLPLSPRAIKPMPTIGDMVKLEHGVQISPRAPGMKRRKSQAKKVVCIPAPAAASSRPSGEVVPSDLWAWRKYGQKPIKGSPYPRGYYRCSSSKGCSARKQVERSRTDPNMLVITYTSEHNHPWPTQRNALAGSTRTQPHKNSSTSSTSKSSTSTLKEEPKNINPNTNSSSSLPTVKEEVVSGMDNVTVDNVFYNEPASMAGSSQPDDFFADLAELEPDPMSLIFSGSGFVGQKPETDQEKESSKGLDPFIDNMFNW